MPSSKDHLLFWTEEKINSLDSRSEIESLRDNALRLGNQVLADRCESVLNSKYRKKQNHRQRSPRRSMFPPLDEVREYLVDKFLNLPDLNTELSSSQKKIVQSRIDIQDKPVRSLADLWFCYMTCALSSQERSSWDSKFGVFCRSDHVVLNLRSLQKELVTEVWLTEQLKEHLPRMLKNKVRLVYDAYGNFARLGSPHLDLRDASATGPLAIFVQLAQGVLSDRDIVSSASFSASLNPGLLRGVGHKQIRNILVNSGLAVNVIPIDSRWLNFMNLVEFSDWTPNLQNLDEYLLVEDLVRQALIQCSNSRADITNLAILDSVVFSQQE